MRREFVRLFETLSTIRPVIVFLDDLHWADASTCGLLAYLGSRMKNIRILILATYRPAGLFASHPFLPVRLSLERSGVCQEMPLEFLKLRDIEFYLALRFPAHAFSSEFVNLVQERTEGSPLYLRDMFDFLLDKRVLLNEAGQWRITHEIAEIRKVIPTGSQGMIRLQIDQFAGLDRQILRCAAVQGVEFDSEVICRALTLEPVEVEEHLQAIERVTGLSAASENGGFPTSHSLSATDSPTSTIKMRCTPIWPRPAARPTVWLWQTRSSSSTGTPDGRWRPRLLRCLSVRGTINGLRSISSAPHAMRRACSLTRRPSSLCERGLAILPLMAESRERDSRELKFSLILGLAQMATCGFAAPEVEKTHRRSRELCLRLNEKRHLVKVLWAMHTCLVNAGELVSALELARRCQQAASELGDPVSVVESLHALGTTHAFMGNLTDARETLERVFTVLPIDQHKFSP